jgi:hypothetical protein
VSKLLELAERCEAATGPSVVLDDLILAAIEGVPITCIDGGSRSYTASLDAAMTLVPEGWGVNLNTPGDFHGTPQVRLKHPERNPYGDGEPMRGSAATPALALCAAALRARAAQ